MAYLSENAGHPSALPGSQIHGTWTEPGRADRDRCLRQDLVPAAGGTYALLLRLGEERRLEVGRLGAVAFPPATTSTWAAP